MKVLKLLLLLNFITIYNIHALELTIEEAINLAIARNNTIKAQESEIDSARGTRISGFSGFLPKIDARLSYYLGEKGYFINNSIPAGAFGPGFPPEDLSFGLNSESFTYDYTVGVTLTQPIYAGGKIWHGYKMSVLGERIQREKLRQTKNDVIFQVKEAFYRVLLAESFYNVSKEAKSLSEEHLRVARARYRTGEATEYEVLRAEVEFANIDSQLIKAENAVQLSLIALKNIIGLDENEEVKVIGEFVAPRFEMSLEECLKNARTARPEVIQMQLQKDIVAHNYRLAIGGYLPNLTLVGNYQALNNKEHSSRLFDKPQDRFLESYSFMLMLSLPIFDGLYNYGKIKEARAGMRKINEFNIQLDRNIALEIQHAYSSLKEAEKVMSAGEKNVQTAQRAVEIAQVQYKNGLITSLELLSAEVGLTQAKTNYLQAKYDYIIAYSKLKKAIGQEF